MSAATFFSGISDRLRRRVAPSKTIGTSGTVVLAGFVESNEKNPRVRGDERYKTWSDMLSNVDVIGASVRYYLNLGAKATWTVEPADDTPAAKDVAEFVDDVIHDLRKPWHRVVRRALMYRYYGFSVQEWTAKRRDDGKVGFLDIDPRPQSTIERWDTEPDGQVLGVTQRIPATGQEVYLPRSKVVYVVDDSLSDSPEGLGIFRHMTETAYRLQRYELLEAFGFETDLRGIPKGRAPMARLESMVKDGVISPAERDAIKKPLEDFIEGHIKSPELGLLLDSSTYRDEGENATPSGTPLWDLELLTGGSTSANAIAAAIERLQRELARLAGTEGLLLGGDKVGSLALSRDKSQNFALVVDSALNELSETFDQDVIGALMGLNGIAEDLWPSFKPEQIQYRDVEQITQALVDLATAGAPLAPDDPAIDVVRAILGLPPQPEPDMLDASLRGGGPTPPPAPNPDDPEPPPEPEPEVVE